MTHSPEHLAWRARERATTDRLLIVYVQTMPRQHQLAAAARIRDAKHYPR